MIPTNPADCAERLPVETCPSAEPITYTIPLQGGWNTPIEGFPEELYPALIILAPTNEITPDLPGDGNVDVELSVAFVLEPIEGAPSMADVPATFQVMNTQVDQPLVGVSLPLAQVLQFMPTGTPFWLRQVYTDANGCETTVFILVASGLQPEPTDLTLYVLIGGSDEPAIEQVIEAPADPEDPTHQGPMIALEIEATPVCPAPGHFVPVGPACGAAGIPVTIVGEGPDEPTAVVNAEDEGGDPIPLLVTTDDAPPAPPELRELTAQTFSLEVPVGGPADSEVIPDGWVMLVVAGVQGASPTDGRIWIELAGAASIDLVRSSGAGGVAFQADPLTAPAGTVLSGAIIKAENYGTADLYANATAYYPV